MRYEAIWLVQFLATVTVLSAVFGAGLWTGWRRWGRSGPADWDTLRAEVEVVPASGGRRDLFAPEVDLRGHAGGDWAERGAGELSAGS